MPEFLLWPFQPKNAAAVGGWGFWFGILGLIGLALTFLQLLRTKSAADAARKATEKIRSAMKSYDAATEASKAGYALSTAKKHFNNSAILDGAESYEDFRRSILSLKQCMSNIDQEISSQIGSASASILILCKKIDRDIKQQTNLVDYTKVNDSIRRHADLLRRIELEIKEETF